MSKTIRQRRKTDRERLKRWRQKKLAEGNKQIQLMLTPEAQNVLMHEKERTGEPYVQIINRAIISIDKNHPSILYKIKPRPLEQQRIIRRIRKLWAEGYTYSAIADIFNDEDIKTFNGPGKWHAGSVLDLDKSG